jgi:oxysterol-binding protein-related protein 9/10/11
MSHPTANITGFISLKVHPYVTVQDYCVITCPKTKIKALLKYHDEVCMVCMALMSRVGL